MRKFVILVAVAIPLAAVPARADTLDKILDVAIATIDPTLKPARPIIRCVLDGTSVSACVSAFAQDKAASAAAGNPNLVTVINIVKAIQKHDWITVLDIAGTDLLFKLACAGGMPPTGPLKEFLCGSITGELTKLSKPVVRRVLVDVRDRQWGQLILDLGPDVACSLSIIPAEIRLPVCTGLDAVLKGSLVAFKAMLDGLGDELNGLLSLGDKLLGSDVKKLAPKQYFAVFWAPYLAKATGLKMTHADSGLSQLVSNIGHSCPGYYGTSTPCDAMKKIFLKAVDQSALSLQSTVLPYYDTHLKGDLLYHHLFLVGSKGNSIGFGSAPGNSCPAELYKFVPLPSGDGDASPSPSPWSAACAQVGEVLRAELEKNKAALFLELEALLKKGCNVTTGGSVSCPVYAGHAACLKLLPTHPNTCVLDQDKAAQALADEILKTLGPKRCGLKGAYGWEHKIIECTRPWKRQACQVMVASATPAGVNDKVNCNEKPDAAFDQGKAKVLQVVQYLNSGKVLLATPGGPPTIMGTGKPYAFKPAGCKPATPDPLKVECQEWAVVSDVASKVPFLSLPTCAQDLLADGADTPCFARVAFARSGP